jgi:hypothetical protein
MLHRIDWPFLALLLLIGLLIVLMRAKALERLIQMLMQEARRLGGAQFLSRDYIFDLQVLVLASQAPPALSQSAFVLAMVTSPAKADVAKATPRARANA